jgi:signal transduction histidine kinase
VNIEAPTINRLSQKVVQHVMSITREAVSNSLRHSAASTISVSLEEHGTEVRLTIKDDGVGFDPGHRFSQNHGLRNIAARTRQIGGTLEVIAQRGQGTSILVHFSQEQSHVLT